MKTQLFFNHIQTWLVSDFFTQIICNGIHNYQHFVWTQNELYETLRNGGSIAAFSENYPPISIYYNSNFVIF